MSEGNINVAAPSFQDTSEKYCEITSIFRALRSAPNPLAIPSFSLV